MQKSKTKSANYEVTSVGKSLVDLHEAVLVAALIIDKKVWKCIPTVDMIVECQLISRISGLASENPSCL